MERCESCGRELAPTWKYCIYCGRPVGTVITPVVALAAVEDRIPAAIRPELDDEPPARKYDAPFWVGISMGALGLALIIYAAIQIYTAYA